MYCVGGTPRKRLFDNQRKKDCRFIRIVSRKSVVLCCWIKFVWWMGVPVFCGLAVVRLWKILRMHFMWHKRICINGGLARIQHKRVHYEANSCSWVLLKSICTDQRDSLYEMLCEKVGQGCDQLMEIQAAGYTAWVILYIVYAYSFTTSKWQLLLLKLFFDDGKYRIFKRLGNWKSEVTHFTQSIRNLAYWVSSYVYCFVWTLTMQVRTSIKTFCLAEHYILV